MFRTVWDVQKSQDVGNLPEFRTVFRMVDTDEGIPLRPLVPLNLDQVVMFQFRKVAVAEVPQRHGIVVLLGMLFVQLSF